MSPNIWANFVRKFVAKIFQKWPNLVTLLPNDIKTTLKAQSQH